MISAGDGIEARPGPPLPDRRVLRDDDLDARLRSEGVVVIDLMPPERVLAIAEVILDIYRGDTSGQHYTLLSEDFDYRHRVFDTVPELLADVSSKTFSDYAFCATSLAFKWPGADAVLGPHQDISLVDERRYRSYNLWLPLVDTDESNGALRFLKGSHHVLDNLRTMPSGPTNFLHEAHMVAMEDLELIPTRLGQAIVFDHAMLHASGPNLTDAVRPALIAAYRPAEAELLHFFLPDLEGREVEQYDADGDFYRSQLVGEAPAVDPDKLIMYYGTPRSRNDIVRLSRAASPPVRTVVPPIVASDLERGMIDSAPVGPGVRRTFLDDELQRRLAEDGYVVFDALQPEEIAELKEIVTEIFPGEPAGFHASNCRNDPDYRRLVHRRCGPILERAVGPLLDDYAHCNTLSTMKFPGEGSGFVVHQDWKVVDERSFRGVNVWCPLVDAHASNGGLLVLPGSHMLLNAVRCGPDFPNWYTAPGTQVSWDEMVVVEVNAGQALMFDHRLLHSSGPNWSSELRPAVVAVMAPAEAQLHHWYLPDPDDDRLEVLAVDRDFFCDFEVGVRPDYLAIAEVPFVPDLITTDELLEACTGYRRRRATHPSPTEEELSASDAVEEGGAAVSLPGRLNSLHPRRLVRRVRRGLSRR